MGSKVDKLKSFIHKYFKKVFDGLTIISTYGSDSDHPYQMDWVDGNGHKMFERNTWGKFWVYDCEMYDQLKYGAKIMSLSYEEFQELLIDYLNERYFNEFGSKQPLKEIGNEYCDDY
jgi:hypothetical protein